PADRGQRRARTARGRASCRARDAASRRPARGDQLPLARGPDREAVHGGAVEGLHVPARLPRVRVWQGAGRARAHPQASAPLVPRARRQPAGGVRASTRRDKGLMSTIADGAVAARKRPPQEGRKVTPAPVAKAPFAGGILWIVLVAALLAGVVAV